MKLIIYLGILLSILFSQNVFGAGGGGGCAASCAGLPAAMQASCLAACGGATGGTGTGSGGIPGIPGTGAGGIPITIAATPGMQAAIDNANVNWGNSNANWTESNSLWSQVLTGTNPDGSLNTVGQILSGTNADGTPNTIAQGLAVANNANDNWAMTNSILDRVARPEFAFAMSAATAIGGFVGTAAIEGISSLLINGASWIYSSLHELITNEQEKSRLLEGYQKAEELYEQLSNTRNNLFTALNRSLQDLKVHEELRQMGFEADLRDRLGEVREQGAQARRIIRDGSDDLIIDLRVDLDRTRAYMRDPLQLTRDCHRKLMVQVERLNARIEDRERSNLREAEEYERLANTMQQVIDRIGPEANPKIYLCNQLHEQINNLFRIETEMQRARASLIAGHFVMLSHQDELSSQARELFEDGVRFSDTSGLEDYIADVLGDANSDTERMDIRAAHVAAVNSHRRTERLFASMNDGSVPMNPNLEIRGSRLSRGSRIRTIRQEQLCAVNPLECESLGVRDYRTEGIRYYGELTNTCQDTVEGMREDYNDVMDGLSFTEMVAASDVGEAGFNISEIRRQEIELPLQVEQAIREVSAAKRELKRARGPEAQERAQRNYDAAVANEAYAKLRLAQLDTQKAANEARRSRSQEITGNRGQAGLSMELTARFYEQKSEELVLKADALEHIDGEITYLTSSLERARSDLSAGDTPERRERVANAERQLEEANAQKRELDANPDMIDRLRRQSLHAQRRSLEMNIEANQSLAEFYRQNRDARTARRHENAVAKYQMKLQGFVDRYGN